MTTISTSRRRSARKGEREARRRLEVAWLPSLKEFIFIRIHTMITIQMMLGFCHKKYCCWVFVINCERDEIRPALDETILEDLPTSLQLVSHLGQHQPLVLPSLQHVTDASTKPNLKCFAQLWDASLLCDASLYALEMSAQLHMFEVCAWQWRRFSSCWKQMKSVIETSLSNRMLVPTYRKDPCFPLSLQRPSSLKGRVN